MCSSVERTNAGSTPAIEIGDDTMKISMWIPTTKNPVWIQNFINNEMNQAGNIKSKQTRESIIDSLFVAQRTVKPGVCLYIDGTDATEETYPDKEFKYYCGHEYIRPITPTEFK